MHGNGRTLAYLKTLSELRPTSPRNLVTVETATWKSLFVHPGVFERLWVTLPAALPQDCRAIAYGSPVLQHPQTGLIFAIAFGTNYALFVPFGALNDIEVDEHDFARKMTGGEVIDLRVELGDGWLFGRWREVELEWCRRAYDEAARCLV